MVSKSDTFRWPPHSSTLLSEKEEEEAHCYQKLITFYVLRMERCKDLGAAVHRDSALVSLHFIDLHSRVGHLDAPYGKRSTVSKSETVSDDTENCKDGTVSTVFSAV